MSTPEWWGHSLAELTLAPPTPQAAIVTFSQAVDTLLGSGGGAAGVPLGQLTELCGLAGAGKTQMALQLCLDVQIPAQLGGCGGGAVFVDAEGGLQPCRLAAMAAKVEEHMGKIIDKDPERYRAGAGGASSPSAAPPAPAADVGRWLKARVSAAALLANVAYARVTSLAALTEAILEGLPALLRQRAAAPGGRSGADAPLPIRLVVIDSLAFHFRAAGDLDGGERARRLAALGVALTRLAQAHDCAVVVTNHLVTQREAAAAAAPGAQPPPAAAAAAAAAHAALAPHEALAAALDPDTSRLLPALGDAWAHFPALRLHLRWERGSRCAALSKCLLAAGLPPGSQQGAGSAALLASAPFSVQREGIRGLGAGKRAKK